MMRKSRVPGRWWQAQEGAAATEFALLTLILVPTLFYAIYFYELTLVKIKAQEAGRYLVWEMSAKGLSDWKDGDHDQRFTSMRSQLLNEVQQRWGDDLQSATPTVLAGTADAKPLTLTVEVKSDQVELTNEDAGLWDANIANGMDTGQIASSIDQLFEWMNFTKKGKVKGTIKFHVVNKLTGPTMILGYREKKFLADELDISVSQEMIVEQWDLKQGNSVVQNGQDGCSLDYCYQVDRMHLLGIGNEFQAVSDVLNVLADLILFHNPLEGTVASIPMDRYSSAKSDHDLDVPRIEDPPHTPLYKHYTNVWKDTHVQNPPTSPYTKVYARLGPNYMGCYEEQMQDGECQYNSH